MKRKLLFIILLIPVVLFAQKSKPWNKALYDAYPHHFGFSFSAGILDFSVAHAYYDNPNFLAKEDSIFSVEGHAKPLFGASMVANLRLNGNWDLRFTPGLHFGQRNLDYLVLRKDSSVYSHTMKIESTLLQFPILLKYRATRQNNYRPYVIFGVNYAIDLAARKKIKEEERPKIRLNRNDVYLEMGFGVDYYLPYFKFSTEVRFSYGLLNVVNYDNTGFTNVFDRLGSKKVTFIIYFE